MGAALAGDPKPLALTFGAEIQGRRGPTLGSILVPGLQEDTWRLVLVAPLRIQVFDAHTEAPAEPGPDQADIRTLVQDHTPFTSFACREAQLLAGGNHGEAPCTIFAVGSQDGTAMVFPVADGGIKGQVKEFRAGPRDVQEHGESHHGADLANCLTAVQLSKCGLLFAASFGICYCWDIRTGELQREFHLPGGGRSVATASSLALVQGAGSPGREGLQLWVGMDNGSIAVFDVRTGVLTRSLSTEGQEVVVTLCYCQMHSVVFALRAHRSVSVWDTTTYTCLQRYPAELVTCGADLAAISTVTPRGADVSLLLLAGVDGSLCVRRINRRGQGKLNCVLLWCAESANGDAGCPITSINYHAATDSVLLGDAGCVVSLLPRLQEQLGCSVQMAEPTTVPRVSIHEEDHSHGSAHPVSLPERIALTGSPTGREPLPPLPPPADTPPEEASEGGRHVSEQGTAAAFPVFSGS